MKKALLIIVAVACLSSCSKEKNPNRLTDLFGKWELRVISGGFSQPVVQPAGNGDIYQFNKDSTYVRYLNGEVKGQGRFHLNITERRDTVYFGTISLTNPTYNDAWAQSPNTISIGTSIADGPTYQYRKIK